MDKEEIEGVLQSQQMVSRKHKAVKLVSWSRAKDKDIALIFSILKDRELVIDKILSLRVTKKSNQSSRIQIKKRVIENVDKFISDCKELDIDLSFSVKVKTKRKTVKKIVKETVGGLKKQISFLNCHSTKLEEQLLEIGKKYSNKTDLVKEYEQLLVLFLAKARGEIVTQTTKRQVVIERDDSGNIVSEKNKLNSDNKEAIYIETQSHLPDAQALASTFIINELIETLKGKMGNEATDEELEQSYRKRLQKAQDDRKLLKGRGNFEDDVIDAEIE